MAAENFARALALVLVHEGGKGDDPRDPGGRTNAGITHIDYDLYRKSKKLPLRDVWDMDDSERDDIYRTRYWDAVSADALPAGIDYVVFDGAVNSGISQSVKWLQRALGNVGVDGVLGPATLDVTVNCPDLQKLARTALKARLAFLEQLRTFSVFGKGWTKRVNDVEAAALAWIAGAQIPFAVAATQTSAKAARKSAVSPPSTAPGDVLTAVAGTGLAAAAVANTSAVTTAPVAGSPQSPSAPVIAAAPAEPTPAAIPATAPPATPPAKPATNAISASPAPAASSAKPAATTRQSPAPAHATTIAPQAQSSFLTIAESHLPLIESGLGILLASGLFMSWGSRRARAKLADALGDTPIPKIKLKLAANAAVAYAAQSTGFTSWLSIAKSVAVRALSAIWIMGTIAVNVIALAKLLQVLGVEHETWHGPFVALGNLYDGYAGQAFAATSAYVGAQFGLTLPQWLMPLLILYVSSASAFVVAGTGIVGRHDSAESFLGAIVHAGWILAVPTFVLDAIRYQVVTRFARQNTLIFFLYVLAFGAIYIGARYVNDSYFASPVEAARATTIFTQVQHDAAALMPVLKQP